MSNKAVSLFPHANAFWTLLKDLKPKVSFHGDAHLEESKTLSFHLEEGRLEDISQGSSRACALRYLIGSDGETLIFGSDSWDPMKLFGLARKMFFRPSRAKTSPAVPLAKRIVYQDSFEHPLKIPLASISFDKKAKLLMDINHRLRELGGSVLRQITISYGEGERKIFQMTTEGSLLVEIKSSVVFSVQVLVKEDGLTQSAHEVHGAIGGWEIIEDLNPMKMAEAVLARALKKLKAPASPCGEFPVVIAASAGGTFVHEAIGHSLEADSVQDGISPVYKGKIGQVVAPDNISIIDDPTLPGFRGTYHFDDEGVVAKPTRLVDHGVLRDYLYDRVTASRENKASNGHGRRQSSLARPIPRMSNLYIEPGADDPGDIIRSLQHGVLVTRMGGGQVNTATGQFIFEVEEGFLVENGEVGPMIRDANLLGVGPEVLKSITRVGKDLGWAVGTCGKEGQGVAVADGLPTILISKMLVGGTNIS